MKSGAIFSGCGKYRFALWREWTDRELPNMVAFVGLNPSTAGAEDDDPTIRRVTAFAKCAGFDGFYMLNLFPCIATDPRQLVVEVSEDILDEQEYRLHHYIDMSEAIVFCWGSHKLAAGPGAELAARYPNALCFGHNADGSPKHPLYLPSNTELVKYRR